MTLYIILFGALFGVGLFFILADVFKLPTIATEKVLISASCSSVKKVSVIDTLLFDFAMKISKNLSINEYKRVRMKNVLNAAGLPQTPEEYTASCIVKALLIGVGVIPCLMIFPIGAPVLMVLAILTYFKEMGKSDALFKEKRGKIEVQLPRFVVTIIQELKNS